MYNIEKPFRTTRTQLTIYQTSDYTVANTLFADVSQMSLEYLEFGKEEKGYVLGFMRDENGIFDYGFIGSLLGELSVFNLTCF